jgi:hypothetical protein
MSGAVAYEKRKLAQYGLEPDDYHALLEAQGEVARFAEHPRMRPGLWPSITTTRQARFGGFSVDAATPAWGTSRTIHCCLRRPPTIYV